MWPKAPFEKSQYAVNFSFNTNTRQKQVPQWLFSEMKLKRYRFYENLVNSRATQACTFFLAMHLILPFKSSAKFLNVLVLSGIFGRDIRCDVNKRFTPRWQEVCGKYQK